jgi:hypothetical protein
VDDALVPKHSISTKITVFLRTFIEIRDTVLDRRNLKLPARGPRKKAPQKVARNNSIARPGKGKRQDSPIALMEELAKYPFPCPNCSVTFDDVKLFCSDLCAEEARHVRYARRCKAEGRDEDPLVKER